ncbi:hypothetical protein CLOP_g15126 [Closterium sp. NIES-67]|nr:hypothetical protein CLOP_g15126 [Closterium sp. NIES-67]
MRASLETLSARRPRPAPGRQGGRFHALSAAQLVLLALLAVGVTGHKKAAAAYSSASLHAAGNSMRTLGRWHAREAEAAGGRALIDRRSSSSSSIIRSGSGEQGEQGEEVPEWARSELRRWEAAQARERRRTAEKAEMGRALWAETEAGFEARLAEWQAQGARMQKVAERRRAKRARRARSKWARAQRAQARARAESTSSGVSGDGGDVGSGGSGATAAGAAGGAGGVGVASLTEDELTDLMPGGTRSWQHLKATTTARPPSSFFPTAPTTTPSSFFPTASSSSVADGNETSTFPSTLSSSPFSTPSSSASDGNDTSTSTPWEERRPSGDSPCSPRSTGPVINVTSVADILSRMQYPPTQTVTLVLLASISLNRSLLLDSNFSCTIFRADSLPSQHALEITTDTEPVLQVHNASNIVFIGISLRSPVRNGSAYCESLPEYGALLGNDLLCPALLIYRSYGIQFTQASVIGRIDVFRCAYTKLDSLFATAPWDYAYHPGVIRMGMSGIGVNLTSSENIISNNDLFGAWELIYLYRGTIGATVRNNFLHDYLFAGFRCGADVHFAWDCALTTVAHNFVFSPQKKDLTGDSAGIYFCTHWFNPGNTVTCNYVIGGDHCYYLDYCTSGVVIQGGVCLQLWDGVKLNNGKRNHIRSLLMVGLGQSPGYITCFTVTVNHCGKDPGSYWEAMRKLYYDTPEINKEWPWMKHVCRQTRIGAYSCNPRGHNALTAHETGACSGLATENDVEYIVVDPDTSRDAEYRYCERNPGAHHLNRQVVYRYSGDEMKFADYKNEDFAVTEGSVVLAKHPEFVSCPRKDVGTKPVSIHSYYKDWNIPEPSFFQAILDLPYEMVFNNDLY